MKWRIFQPRKGKTLKQYKIIGYDTEDDGEGNVQGGCTYDAETGTVKSFTDMRKMRRFLEGPSLEGHALVAHNAEYDIANIWGIGGLDAFSFYAKSGSLFKLATLNHGKHARTIFLDSYGHFQGPLKEMGDFMGLPKLNDPGLKMPWSKRREYCIRDAEIVAKFMAQLQESYLSLGTSLHPSAGGSAMELYQRKYLPLAWRALPRSLWEYQASGYHGGRAEAFRMGEIHEPVNCYDVASQYPFIARDALLPNPDTFVFKKNPAPNCLDYEGITRARVSVRGHKPPLPLKRGQLIFPVGEFTGTWPNNLLRYAVNSGEVRILKLLSTCSAVQSGYHLREFMQDMYDIKTNEEKPIALRKASKWLMNALTGKFGQRDTVTQWNREASDFVNVKTVPPSFSVPAWSSAITGGGMAYMHGFFNDKTLYTATDSIHTTDSMEVGVNLGDFKLEKVSNDPNVPYCIKGLAYRTKSVNGSVEYKVRGAPQQARRNETWFSPAAEVFESGYSEWRKPLKMLEARRRHLKENTWVLKPFHPKFEVKKRTVLPDGSTEPLRLKEE
jgi:hypothetical protein